MVARKRSDQGVRADHLVKEVDAAQPFVHEVNIGPQGERRIGVPKPLRYLPDVLALLKEDRRGGVSERVEADPRHTGPLSGPVEYATDIPVPVARAGSSSEHRSIRPSRPGGP